MNEDEAAAIARTELDVRIGGEAVAFLQSETVRTFLERTESALLTQAIALPAEAHSERFLALKAVDVIRKLRGFMKLAADQRGYNERQLEALYKAAEEAEE